MERIYTTKHGDKFICTDEQAALLDTLSSLANGGIGTIHGYQPSTGYTIAPVLDVQVISKISTTALYKRRIEALDGIAFADVEEAIKENPKLAALDKSEARKIFNTRKERMIASMEKTLGGDRSDALREGIDRNNITVCQGVRVNLVGSKKDGIKIPDLFWCNGEQLPKCDAILLQCLEIRRTVIKPGQYKTVNSGVDVLMDKAIEKQLNSRSVQMKSFSLDPSKFEKLVIGKKNITRDDLIDATADMGMADLIIYLIEQYEK